MDGRMDEGSSMPCSPPLVDGNVAKPLGRSASIGHLTKSSAHWKPHSVLFHSRLQGPSAVNAQYSSEVDGLLLGWHFPI